MRVTVSARLLAIVLGLGWSVSGAAQPAAQPEAPEPAEAPPHLIRVEGPGLQVVREGRAEAAMAGDPVLFGDRLESGSAYAQVLWGDGSRIAVDRGARLEALAPDLLALTAGRALVTRPANAPTPLRLDTPAASLILAPGGEYRVEFDDVQATIGVVRGRADVQTAMGEQAVEPGQQVAVRDGVAPGAPQRFNAAGYDSFVQWALQPAAAPATGAPLDTFADPRFEAYSDVFNQYGSWQTDPRMGAVWYPTVGAAWRPYADGYWQAYGPQDSWLWVARDPWGWPTHHFGRWDVDPRGRWFWMPGRQWAPAWVTWSVGPGYVGWTPLGAHDRPVRPWGDFSGRAGAYAGGTLDPARAWTVVPADRFGQRERLGAYAVDPRTLDNISAFVTQRVGPPVRHVGRGGVYGGVGPGGYVGGPSPYGGPGGTTVYGPGGYYGGVRPRTGDDTTREIRGGIGPTRVGPASPGYGGPTPPPEDPYERAQRAVVPRGRPRSEAPPATAPSATPRQPAPAEETRPRTPPPAEQAQPKTPPDARADAPPPADQPAPPAPTRATGTTNGRRAVPRP